MLICCWAAKGGAGTTVVAACLALQLTTREVGGAVLADLAGDVPAALGLPEPETQGLAGWLAAGDEVPADALGRLELDAAPGLTVLPRGTGPLEARRAPVLATLLEQSRRAVVADCGSRLDEVGTLLANRASRSLLVTRPCYLALRHATQAAQRPAGVVLVREPGRALSRHDVEQVVGAPVVAEVEVDPAIARAVDAGLLVVPRLPRALRRGLRHAV